MIKMKIAALYVRVSTHEQDELSLDAQIRLGKNYAKEHGFLLPNQYIFAESISGRKADKRQEFQRMIAMAKNDPTPFDTILVWKFSRFARNQEESIVYKSLLRKQCNIDVVSVSEPLIEGPFGSLIERIIEWMDEYYSIRLSGEVTRGMEEKAMRNGYQMVPPLGYRAIGEGKPFVIDEDEYKIVSFIFDQFDNHHADYTSICRKLNEAGYLTRRNRPFEMRGIKRILANPFYYGLVIWKDISFIGEHEVRLSKEQYDERMERIQKQFRPARRKDVSSCKHWLSGLIKCGYCGATLSFSGNGNHSPFFQCHKYSKGIHNESCSISVKKATAAVYEYFEGLLSGMDFEYVYHAPESSEQIDARSQLEDELKKIDSREARIRLAFENEIDTLEEYKENKLRLKAAREEIEEKLRNLDDSSDNVPSKSDVLEKVKTVYDVIKNDDIDYETKGAFMRSLMEDIVYDKKNGKMIFTLYIS